MIDKNSLFEKLISKLEEKAQFPEQWELIDDNVLVSGDGFSENFNNDKRIQDAYLELDKNYKEWLPQKYEMKKEEGLKKLWDALDK